VFPAPFVHPDLGSAPALSVANQDRSAPRGRGRARRARAPLGRAARARHNTTINRNWYLSVPAREARGRRSAKARDRRPPRGAAAGFASGCGLCPQVVDVPGQTVVRGQDDLGLESRNRNERASPRSLREREHDPVARDVEAVARAPGVVPNPPVRLAPGLDERERQVSGGDAKIRVRARRVSGRRCGPRWSRLRAP
jgi:hypothetical protein